MKKTTKKLAFSATTVRTLQQTMSEEQLQEVAGGTQIPQPQMPVTTGGPGPIAGPKTGVTISKVGCTSMPTTGPGAC